MSNAVMIFFSLSSLRMRWHSLQVYWAFITSLGISCVDVLIGKHYQGRSKPNTAATRDIAVQ